MLPNSIRQRFASPGKLENEFLNYLEKANLTFDNSKTIASQTLYHQATMTANGYVFFDGDFVQAETNVPGSNFIRPQSEHFVIYAIRIETAADQTVNPFVPGTNTNLPLNNSVITINNNNVTELKNFPCSEALGALFTKDLGLITLDEPIIWGGSTQLTINLKPKQGAFVPPFAVRIKLIGIGLV